MIGMAVIKENLPDISSTLYTGHKEAIVNEVRLWMPTENPEPATAYIGTEDQFFHDRGKRIVCICDSSYIIFDSEDLAFIMNRILETFRYYAKWQETCYQMIENGCSLSELLAVTEPVLKHPLLIIDASQFIIGISPSAITHSESQVWTDAMQDMSISSEVLLQFNAEHADTFQEKSFFHLPADYFPAESSCHHIFLNDDRIGTLIIVENTMSMTPGQARIAEIFLPIIAYWIQSGKETDSSAHNISVFAKMLDQAPDAQMHLERRLKLFGWEETAPLLLITARSISESVHNNSHLSHILSDEQKGIYSIPYGQYLLILANLSIMPATSLNDDLVQRFSQSHYYGAESFLFHSINDLPSAYEYTRIILSRCSAEPGRIYNGRQYALEFFLQSIKPHVLSSLLHPLPAKMIEYDSVHKTEYAMTLFSFLKNEQNHSLTSSHLFIHRNTLFQRLRKIVSIWNPDLGNSDERFLLLYTFYYYFQ